MAMNLPLTPYGKKEIRLWGGALFACTVGIGILAPQPYVALALPFLLALVCLLCFFRDPEREPPVNPDALLSPADGKVVEIAEVKEDTFIGGPCLRIGIFMSVFNVHVNRAPCAGTVEYLSHKDGQYLNARNQAASERNERQYVGLITPEGRRVMFSQIAGMVARRIVCTCAPGQKLAPGERFGMIKFGSRCEVYVAKSLPFETDVKVGQKTQAGVTILGRFTHKAKSDVEAVPE